MTLALLALALALGAGAVAAATAAAEQPEQQPCASPIFIGALDLGGGLAVAFRSVGSRWLELRGTAGFEVRLRVMAAGTLQMSARWPSATPLAPT